MNRMLRAVPFLIVLGAFAACEREPDELLFIVGKVTDTAGVPRPAIAVHLFRNGSENCRSAVYEVGPSIGYDAGSWAEFSVFHANDAGDFLFEMTQRDTRVDDSLWGGPGCFQVSAASQGGSTRAEFVHPEDDVELQNLPLPPDVPQLSAEGDGLRVSGPAVDLSIYAMSTGGFSVLAGDALAWVTEETAVGGKVERAVDPAWLEDFADPSIRYDAAALSSEERGGISFGGFLEYTLEVQSGAAALSPGALVPLSRGAKCSAPWAPDEPSCWLTDGKLDAVQPAPVQLDGGELTSFTTESLILDFTEARTLQRVLIRGLQPTGSGSIFVEGSLNGNDWTELASWVPPSFTDFNANFQAEAVRFRRAGGLYLDLPFSAPATARFLRVRGTPTPFPGAEPGFEPGPLHFLGAREISVF